MRDICVLYVMLVVVVPMYNKSSLRLCLTK